MDDYSTGRMIDPKEVKPSREELYRQLRQHKNEATRQVYFIANNFRTKMNLLISKTPSGDLRNEYTDMNILFENIIREYEFLLK